MRLLFVTQVVDKNDSTLGAYHAWLSEFAKDFEQIIVICLREGEHTLPDNVRVFSLGKERGKKPGFVYAVFFKYLAWKLRKEYDAVFVHMNQEYVLIAGPMWKVLGKKVYMWRNHYEGSILTDIAALFCTKVFSTSKFSYTAKYRRNVFMPVGVDTSQFYKDDTTQREPRSILFLSRISPSKRPDIFIEALGLLLAKSISFIADVYGSPAAGDEAYYMSLKARAEQLGLKDRVQFHAAIPNTNTPAVYRAHDVFVNCSQNGMFDKTLFEAAACGCLVIAMSEDFMSLAGEQFHFTDSEQLADRIQHFLMLEEDERERASIRLQALALQDSLRDLSLRLKTEITIESAT